MEYVLEYWRGDLHHFWPLIISLYVITFAAGVVLRRFPFYERERVRQWQPRVVLAAALVLGLALAWRRRALFDDAFISFRYIKNFLAGHGLVFNIGERVEGYTNFLWTMVLALLRLVIPVDIPYIALFLCLACFVANLITVWLIGRRLSASRPEQTYFPLATLWLAANFIFTSYGTSGMETMFASWLVNLAVYVRLSRAGVKSAFWSGLLLILATMTHPDHSLFYVCMGLTLVAEHVRAVWRTRSDRRALNASLLAGGKDLLAFASPFAIYVGYSFWKWSYYGSLMPNTAYAKAANLSYWPEGLVYAAATLLSTHLLLILPVFLLWLIWPRDQATAGFRWFVGLSVPVYTLYVIRVGGDFMHGRFFLVLLPLIMLAVEQELHFLARQTSRLGWQTIAVAAALMATLYGLPIAKSYGMTSKMQIADETTWYLVRSLRPLRISPARLTANRLDAGLDLKRVFVDRGFDPVLATGGLGILAYYAELPVIDRRGLTDATIAHMPIRRRGRIGHEKLATQAYLDARQVLLIRASAGDRLAPYTLVRIRRENSMELRLYRYNAVLLKRIAEKAPDFTFTDFPAYLDSNTNLARGEPLIVAQRLQEFDHYYFSLNHDLARRRRFTDRFVRLWDFEDGGLPPGTIAEGSLAHPLLRPAADRDYLIDNYQGETLIASPHGPHKTGRIIFPPFVVQGDELGFLLGGTRDQSHIVAKLMANGQEVRRATGNNSEHLQYIIWRVADLRGQTVQLVLEDRTATGRLLFDMLFEANEED